jgi:hypothetical protein
MRCKTIKTDGTQCKQHVLIDDGEYCIYHSKSEFAQNWRRLPRRKTRIGREELLKKLSKDIRDLDRAEMTVAEKLRIRAKLATLIHSLLGEVEKLDELEERIKTLEADGKI